MHLIQQHSLDISCTSPNIGKEVQSVVGNLMEKDFYPKLELLLEQYSVENYNWKIDAIELNLPNLNEKNWKTDFVTQSLIQIESFLKNNKKEIPLNEDNTDFHSHLVTFTFEAEKLFFEYLKTGIIRTNAVFKSVSEIENQLEINEVFLAKCIAFFEENPTTLIRFILNVSRQFRLKLIDKLTDFPIHKESKLIDSIIRMESFSKTELPLWIEFLQWTSFFISKNKTVQRYKWMQQFLDNSILFWDLTLKNCFEINEMIAFQKQLNSSFFVNPLIVDFFEIWNDFLKTKENSIVDNLSTKEEIDSIFKEATDEKQKNTSPNQHLLYIKNAGLVIFHPFLKSLFEQLDWCENEKWISKKTQQKAILLSQYLITGNQNYFEDELLLNKILCGLPIEEVVNTKLKLTKKELEKANSLLLAVIEYWKILGNTSIEGLRETFLQREGKIELSTDNSSELWVEQKGVDVLLSDLPWGIGLIKTPWMENYMNCYWN